MLNKYIEYLDIFMCSTAFDQNLTIPFNIMVAVFKYKSDTKK